MGSLFGQGVMFIQTGKRLLKIALQTISTVRSGDLPGNLLTQRAVGSQGKMTKTATLSHQNLLKIGDFKASNQLLECANSWLSTPLEEPIPYPHELYRRLGQERIKSTRNRLLTRQTGRHSMIEGECSSRSLWRLGSQLR